MRMIKTLLVTAAAAMLLTVSAQAQVTLRASHQFPGGKGDVRDDMVQMIAKEAGAAIFGIVGKDGGYTKHTANACVVIPPLSADRITPHTEGMCAVVWHLLVSHPKLQRAPTKWESVK